MDSIVSIIVLYNPCEDIIQRYHEIKSQVNSIIYIDNSDQVNKWIDELKTFEKVDYYSMNGNVGLAKALNIGCKKAIEKGYKYAFLLDQDTHVSLNCVESLLATIKANSDCALCAPNIKNFYVSSKDELLLNDKSWYNEIIEETNFSITSGSLIDLKVYSEIGGFDNNLFIMLIDQDYCYRLQKNSMKIIRNGTVFIFQEFGSTKEHKFFYKTAKDPRYSAKRYWYLFRNEHYCRLKNGKGYKKQAVNLFKTLIIILLYDEKRFSKIYSCLIGWIEGGKMYEKCKS